MKKVCVLGSGAFGTAIANILAENGNQVFLWCREESVVDSINKKGCNQEYLPGVKLSENIFPVSSIENAILGKHEFADKTGISGGCEFIFEAVPVKFLRSVLLQAMPYFNQNQVWVCLSKGIEKETLFLPSNILGDVFKNFKNIVAISGPSFAFDLSLRQPTCVDIASCQKDLAYRVSKIIDNKYFKTAFVDDIIGVQVGGALKNLVAIGIGILEGLGYKDNTKILMLSACLKEMASFAEFFGGKQETLYGLSGLSDLIATCMGASSRNLKFGQDLALGKILPIGKSSVNKNFVDLVYPEGVNTAESVLQIIELIKSGKFIAPNNLDLKDQVNLKQGEFIDLRVLNAICEIIFGNKEPLQLPDILIGSC